MKEDLIKGKWADKAKFANEIDKWAKHIIDVSPKVEKEVADMLYSGKTLDTIDILSDYAKKKV